MSILSELNDYLTEERQMTIHPSDLVAGRFAIGSTEVCHSRGACPRMF
jgi:hypothetical protein